MRQVWLAVRLVDEPQVKGPVLVLLGAVLQPEVEPVGSVFQAPVSLRSCTWRTRGCSDRPAPSPATASWTAVPRSAQITVKSRSRRTITPSAALPTRTGAPTTDNR